MNWQCDFCVQMEMGASVGDLRRAGVYVEVSDPDAECATCGDRPSEVTRLRLVMEHLARARADARSGTQATPNPVGVPRRTNPAAGLLSWRVAARRLGISRDTLARLVEADAIASVPKGTRRAFRAVDVEHLIETGYRLPNTPPAPRPAPPKRNRHRFNPTDAAAIAAELAKF